MAAARPAIRRRVDGCEAGHAGRRHAAQTLTASIVLELLPFMAIAGIVLAGLGWALWSDRFGSGREARERQEKLAAQRPMRARARGWRYDDTAEGDIRYRLHGTSPGGRAWTIAYDSDHSSSSSRPKLVFRAPHAGRGGTQWRVSSRRAYESLSSGAGRMILGAVASVLARHSAAFAAHRAFMERAREIPAGSTRFRQRYVLYGVDPSAATLIDGEVERLVLMWPKLPPGAAIGDDALTLSLNADGLDATLACEGPTFEAIEQLAALGERLLDRLPEQR